MFNNFCPDLAVRYPGRRVQLYCSRSWWTREGLDVLRLTAKVMGQKPIITLAACLLGQLCSMYNCRAEDHDRLAMCGIKAVQLCCSPLSLECWSLCLEELSCEQLLRNVPVDMTFPDTLLKLDRVATLCSNGPPQVTDIKDACSCAAHAIFRPRCPARGFSACCVFAKKSSCISVLNIEPSQVLLSYPQC